MDLDQNIHRQRVAKSRIDESRGTSDEYSFPVVAVGASAGGLESLEQLFANVPRDSGVAFVVVQHLSPDFDSVMDQLLSRRTDIPIRQAEDGLRVEPDTIFLIPPKKEGIITSGHFRLRDKEPKEALTLPIDHFFRSLAQDAGPRSIAIVLSGSGSDGSRGVREIHEAGGYVIAESDITAKFDSMPRSAQETGFVDVVLTPVEMADAIMQHVAEPLRIHAKSPRNRLEDKGLELVFGLLNREYGIDFSHYKTSTVSRRIQRRITLREFDSINAYAEQLRQDAVELNSLYHDLLIGVTRFFRDPDAFEKLEKVVIPDVLERVAPHDEIRVWVAGCATGEEPYSIAMLFHEQLERNNRPINVKIFATDVHKASLEVASAGQYGEDALEKVTDARLERYFNRTREGYVIAPDLRRLIVFAPHNLLKDAPFTKLDMVACRNLLIYFQPQAQKKALSLFHFGLKTNGTLVLGPSESPGDFQDEFEKIDEHWKIYRKRRDIRLPAELRYPLTRSIVPASAIAGTASPRGPLLDRSLVGAYDWMLSRYMPAAVLIDDRNELLHVSGDASKFLKVHTGRPSPDVFDLFDGELRTAIVAASARVRKEGHAVRYTGVPVKEGEAKGVYSVNVEPVVNERAVNEQMLITFVREGDSEELSDAELDTKIDEVNLPRASTDRIASLERELRYSKENLQATVEELETSNEELQATNEELIASNEELQSTNEELHSVNEELYTVNAEYQKKISDLTELTADMDSLMESTDVATVFLDRDLKIRKFTPQIVPIFQLIPQDVGRSIESFAHHMDRPGLLTDLRSVLETGEILETDIQNRDGRWMYMRILPYRPRAIVEGVVLTLIDIDKLRIAQEKLSGAIEDRERFLAVLSHEIRNPINAVLSASHLLEADQANTDFSADAVAVIRRQSGHLARLLDDLLDVSRMTQSKLALRKSAMDFRDAIHGAIESMRPAIDQKQQKFDLPMLDTPLPIHGDADRLQQVIVNLLGNASKYSPHHSEIKLTADSDGKTVVVRVQDRGQGISEKMLHSIFDPFFQLKRTREQSEGGMGVGLALVKYVVDGHGGHVSAASEGVGKGSTFTVSLPLIDAKQQPAQTDDPHSNVNSNLDTESTIAINQPRRPKAISSIVIVEDQRDNREMLRALLSMQGFDITTAKTGTEGIEAVLNTRADAALIDLGLPDTTGFSVAQKVREERGEDVYLVALTGHGQADVIRATRESGFDEHLVKPLDLDKLMCLLKPQ